MIKKNTLKKLLISILIFLMLFNFLVSIGGPIGIVTAASQQNIDEVENNAEELIDSRNNGVTGILVWLIRLLVVGIASTFQIETFFVANSAGNDGTVTSVFISPFDIFFNRFTLTNINIFATDDVEVGSFVYNIRINAAMWYYIFRTIALGVVFVLLLYNGIKLLIANLADERAKYKTILVNWVKSVILVLFIHMVIIATINLNEIFIGIIEKAAAAADISNIMDVMMTVSFSDSFLLGIASTMVYVIMVVQTMIYLVIYIKRFFVVVFLIIISPIIPVFCSLDTEKSNLSLALDKWFKELMYNIFVQTLHCIVYVVIVGVPLSSLAAKTSVSSLEDIGIAVVAIFAMFFVKKAEQLLRRILGFDQATTLSSHSSIVNSAVNVGVVGAAAATGGAALAIQTSNARFGQNVSNNNTNNNSWFSNIVNRFASSNNNVTNNFGNNGEMNGADVEPNQDNNYSSGENENEEVNNEGTNNTLVPGAPIPFFATLNNDAETQEAINNFEEAIETQRHSDEQETTNNENNTTTETTEHVEGGRRGLLEELKSKLEKVEENFAALILMKQEDIANDKEKLNELESKLEDGVAGSIRKNMDKMTPEEAAKYAESLGNTPEGEYATAYLKYLQDTKAYDELDEQLDNERDRLISEAKEKGLELSSEDEAALIAGGTVAINRLNELTGKEVEEEVELPQTQIQNVLDENELTKETENVLKNSKTVRDEMINTIKMIELFEGKAVIEGELTDKNLTDFNIQILTKVKQGAYSQNNFKAAEAKVRAEGNEAVKKLEAFKQNQNSANAVALSPAGKDYAKLMLEARQAGLIISSVRTYTEQSSEVTKDVNTQTTQQTYIPSNRTNNVLGNLRNQKSAQG